MQNWQTIKVSKCAHSNIMQVAAVVAEKGFQAIPLQVRRPTSGCPLCGTGHPERVLLGGADSYRCACGFAMRIEQSGQPSASSLTEYAYTALAMVMSGQLVFRADLDTPVAEEAASSQPQPQPVHIQDPAPPSKELTPMRLEKPGPREALFARIVECLVGVKVGMIREEIATCLCVPPGQLVDPLEELRASGRIVRVGQRPNDSGARRNVYAVATEP